LCGFSSYLSPHGLHQDAKNSHRAFQREETQDRRRQSNPSAQRMRPLPAGLARRLSDLPDKKRGRNPCLQEKLVGGLDNELGYLLISLDLGASFCSSPFPTKVAAYRKKSGPHQEHG
jgi:hypothetical protein